MGACVYFPLSVIGSHLERTCAGPVHVASLVSLVILCLEDTVSLTSSIPSGSYDHSASFSP